MLMILKKNVFLVSSIVLFSTIFSCKKIEESIKRDVILTPTGTEFTIPITSSINNGAVFGEFSSSLNLDKAIKDATSDFGISNIQNLRITSLKLDIDTVKDNYTGNFENINIQITGGDKKTTLANVEGNSSAKNKTISIPVSTSATDLKDIISAASFSYKITGKLRTATTAALNARITPTYTITLSK